MRIGFDAKRLFNNFTGLGNYSRTTVSLLNQYSGLDDLWLYTPKVKSCKVTLPFTDESKFNLVMPLGHHNGSLWRTFGLAGQLEKDKINLFHGLSNELPTGLNKRGIRSVVTIHDVAFKTFKDMYHLHDRIIYDAKWRYACRNATRIIAISESTKRDIIRFYGIDEDKIDVVYQPVEELFYTMPDPNSARELAEKAVPGLPSDYMLYVGSVNSRKNLMGIVKAMELLPADLRIPLVVVGGGGDYKKKVREYITSHGLDNLFIFPPRIESNHELQSLYACAKLFVYTSFYEGFGLPVVEAMLSGCPVLTSNVSSLPEAAGSHSLLADPRDIENIADCIQKGLADDALRKSMIENGQFYARQMFNPANIAQRLTEVYSAVSD